MLKPVILQSSCSQEKRKIPTVRQKIVIVTFPLKMNQNCTMLLPGSAPETF